MQRWNSIQLLRAAAAGAVLLFHAHLLSIGFAGVDVFFVISGFIMGKVGLRERPGVFLQRRLIRIVPLYWLVTLGLCLLSLRPGVMAHFAFTGAELAKSLVFIPYRGADGAIAPLLVQGWTLNYEMLFYLVFAACLFTPRPRLIAGMVITGLALAGAVWRPVAPALVSWTAPMLLEFGAGLALAAAPKAPPKALAAVLLGIGLGVFAVLPMIGSLDFEGWSRLLWLGLPAVLVVMGALGVEQAGWLARLPQRPMAWLLLIGDASYALYLTHGLTLPASEKLLRHVPVVSPVLAGVALSIAVGVCCHLWVEKPMSRWLLSRGRRRPTSAKVAGITGATITQG